MEIQSNPLTLLLNSQNLLSVTKVFCRDAPQGTLAFSTERANANANQSAVSASVNTNCLSLILGILANARIFQNVGTIWLGKRGCKQLIERNGGENKLEEQKLLANISQHQEIMIALKQTLLLFVLLNYLLKQFIVNYRW